MNVQDAPVFAYGRTAEGDDIDDDGLPAEAGPWKSLVNACGQAGWVAASAVAAWESTGGDDRRTKLAAIRRLLEEGLEEIARAESGIGPSPL